MCEISDELKSTLLHGCAVSGGVPSRIRTCVRSDIGEVRDKYLLLR